MQQQELVQSALPVGRGLFEMSSSRSAQLRHPGDVVRIPTHAAGWRCTGCNRVPDQTALGLQRRLQVPCYGGEQAGPAAPPRAERTGCACGLCRKPPQNPAGLGPL